MLFNSASYLIFFPSVIVMFYIVPSKLKKVYLLLASWYFYMCWNPYYLILLLLSTVSTWFCGLMMDMVKSKFEKVGGVKNIIIAVCVVINLLILFVFKYSNFFIQNINSILKMFHMQYSINSLDILLPVGISFYTFQAIGYMIDVYREDIKAEKNIIRYALFVSFFPQLVAGPIERSANLLRQIKAMDDVSGKATFADVFDRIEKGLPIVIWGYFQKLVIADRAAIFVDAVFKDFAQYSSLDIVTASVLFAIQIYCDFDGYTNIARGCAKILGFDLMKNFRQPYFAINIKEFWHRWHISLTSWFTDYLYIPLGGNRKGKSWTYINTMIVFIVSGMWHGASWHYIVWGAIHGLLLVGYNMISNGRRNVDTKEFTVVKRIVGMLGTFILTDFAWIFFRANSLREAISMIEYSVTIHNFVPTFPNEMFNQPNMIVLFIGIIVLLIIDIVHERKYSLTDVLWMQNSCFVAIILGVAIMVILIFGVFGGQYDVTQFIYFQF